MMLSVNTPKCDVFEKKFIQKKFFFFFFIIISELLLQTPKLCSKIVYISGLVGEGNVEVCS